jgi:hypothetical protein
MDEYNNIPFDEPWDGQLYRGSRIRKKVKSIIQHPKRPYVHKHKLPRGKAERKRLPARTCDECIGYYRACGLSEAEMNEKIQKCSKHRYHPDEPKEPPKTPPHFWKVHLSPSPDELRHRSIQHWVAKGYTKAEAKDKNRQVTIKQNQLDFWVGNGYTEEEAREKVREIWRKQDERGEEQTRKESTCNNEQNSVNVTPKQATPTRKSRFPKAFEMAPPDEPQHRPIRCWVAEGNTEEEAREKTCANSGRLWKISMGSLFYA